MANGEIPGITVYGLTTFLRRSLPPYPVEYDDDPIGEQQMDVSPVYLAADMIDAGIANGSLTRGIFNNKTVTPPVAAWPERWRFLKEK